jgi:hypothetical protein
MSYTAERGNFEGRSRASGGFGNESGQTERRGRSGEASTANRRAINRAAALSAPAGPFKSPTYDASPQTLTRLGRMIGPMIASPGIGLAAPLAKAILSDDPYGAFGVPSGWSRYSQRDIDPMGSNPRGNVGGRDAAFGDALAPSQRQALLMEALRHPRAVGPGTPTLAPVAPRYSPPALIGDQVPGLPFYGVTGSRLEMAMPRHRKASGYGGVPRPTPIPYPNSSL